MSLLSNFEDFQNNEELTHEMIMTQTDVKFLEPLKEKVNLMKMLICKNDIRSATYFSDLYPEARTALEDVCKILSERFKNNIRIYVGNDGCASTTTIVPGSFNVLTGSNDWQENIKKHFGTKKNTEFKDAKDFVDFSKNVEDYYNILYKNIVALDKELDKFNLKFDNKEAIIYGLPKDFIFVMKLDVCYYLNKKGKDMSAEEFIAILLHEYGHNYTGLEKTYYSIKNSVTLMEAIRETVGNGIKDEISILRVASRKLGGSVTDGGGVQLLADVYNKYTNNYGDDKNGEISRLSNEQQADLFVSRFGLGSSLANALTKDGIWVRYYDKNLDAQWEAAVWSGTILFIYSTLAVVATGVPLLGVIASAAGMLGWWLLLELFLKRYLAKANKFFKTDNKYELDQFRIQRLKQDAIRQLRLLDKKEDAVLCKKLVKTIEQLDEKIKSIVLMTEEIKKNSYLKRVLIEGQFDINSKTILNMSDLIQGMMENNLHYIVTKI